MALIWLGGGEEEGAYIVDFLNGKVGVRWETQVLWININDDQHRVWEITTKKLVDFEVRAAELWA